MEEQEEKLETQQWEILEKINRIVICSFLGNSPASEF